jgi:hypothetical protein
MRRILLAAMLVLALPLGGCSKDKATPPASTLAPIKDQTVDQILIATDAAFRSAKSVRLVGKLVQQDQTMSVDMRITADHKAKGSITRGDAKLSLIRVGSKLWLRGREFWAGTLGPALAARIGDHWVLVPDPVSADSSGSLGALTDIEGVASKIISPSPRSDIQKGAAANVRGVATLELKDASAGSILYVATSGPPFPLRISPKQSKKTAGQRLDFQDYNQPVSIAAPKDVLKL